MPQVNFGCDSWINYVNFGCDSWMMLNVFEPFRTQRASPDDGNDKRKDKDGFLYIFMDLYGISNRLG